MLILVRTRFQCNTSHQVNFKIRTDICLSQLKIAITGNPYY